MKMYSAHDARLLVAKTAGEQLDKTMGIIMGEIVFAAEKGKFSTTMELDREYYTYFSNILTDMGYTVNNLTVAPNTDFITILIDWSVA